MKKIKNINSNTFLSWSVCHQILAETDEIKNIPNYIYTLTITIIIINESVSHVDQLYHLCRVKNNLFLVINKTYEMINRLYILENHH